MSAFVTGKALPRRTLLRGAAAEESCGTAAS